MNVQKVHIALPVANLNATKSFYSEVLKAKILHENEESGTLCMAVEGLEYSFFYTEGFRFWDRNELGPFHIGHQVGNRSDVDTFYNRAQKHGSNVFCKPFEREDGDYACFVSDPDGIIIEMFCGEHKLVRKVL